MHPDERAKWTGLLYGLGLYFANCFAKFWSFWSEIRNGIWSNSNEIQAKANLLFPLLCCGMVMLLRELATRETWGNLETRQLVTSELYSMSRSMRNVVRQCLDVIYPATSSNFKLPFNTTDNFRCR